MSIVAILSFVLFQFPSQDSPSTPPPGSPLRAPLARQPRSLLLLENGHSWSEILFSDFFSTGLGCEEDSLLSLLYEHAIGIL